jgi:hypothetical protein
VAAPSPTTSFRRRLGLSSRPPLAAVAVARTPSPAFRFSGRAFPQVGAPCASVRRCRRSPLLGVGRCRCCHRCCQLNPGYAGKAISEGGLGCGAAPRDRADGLQSRPIEDHIDAHLRLRRHNAPAHALMFRYGCERFTDPLPPAFSRGRVIYCPPLLLPGLSACLRSTAPKIIPRVSRDTSDWPLCSRRPRADVLGMVAVEVASQASARAGRDPFSRSRPGGPPVCWSPAPARGARDAAAAGSMG